MNRLHEARTGWPHNYRRLTASGWSDTEVAALLDDWPVLNLARVAAAFLEAEEICRESDATPAQARAWLRAVRRTDGDDWTFRMSTRTWCWTHKQETGEPADVTALITAYRAAAAGDHDLGVLAFTARLGTEELPALILAGTDPAGLHLLARLAG